ncbi:hypothetical protein PSU4_35210 [Pseudonocardia sulfidoxydans NBRC 16205]|uniref:DUF6286 domain-containing protein n=1 Tax=Pseudonocardia sulfidoxydans NBRC 16205 TaxID=1223511 RepID=A0A511DJG6_9PSEU|nr:DUF6286 domain-containing protein [Pseudonocardia sulfidoxydans]GEL24567.1 hypothetical protein PSU4_35210 [Pseudonocardia sulfidoxydans NBRC 16205]
MRVLVRILAPLLGLALAAVGVLGVVEIVTAWLQPGRGGDGLLVPWRAWQRALDTQLWATTPVKITGIVLGVVGLLLLIAALAARRHDVPLRPPAPHVTVTTSPQALARMVGRRVRAADAVSGASVTASRRAVSVRAEGWEGTVVPPSTDGPAETPTDTRADADTPGLADSVRADVESLLDDLPLAHRPRVAVSVRALGGPR